MLDLGRYLVGVFEIGLLAWLAWLGASALRARLVPSLDGPPSILAAVVITFAILLGTAEVLGTFGLFEPLPYLALVSVVGLGLRLRLGGGWGCPSGAVASRFSHRSLGGNLALKDEKPSKTEGHSYPPSAAAWIALAIAALALVKFALETKTKLGTGMTGFDSTWYHGPFAAGFFQTGDTWSLHLIAPQFLAWFYPANSEVVHAVGVLAFGRDVLSPLLNLGWFVGCLVAAWCIGRPYRVALWSMALAAVALSVPALSDQAGEARNDIVGIFFLMAAVALAISLRCSSAANGEGKEQRSGVGGSTQSLRCSLSTDIGAKEQRSWGGWALVGLAAGLAAGTKLNFLLPAAALVVGFASISPRGMRWRALGVGVLGALAGGGYWYLRNLVHSGNPLPWVKHLGPLDLPAPEQALGGREAHSVFGYLTDGSVWSDWFLPGLHGGLTLLWPLLLAAALAGLALNLTRRADPALRVAATVGLAATLAWLIAPTSASGPDGIPRGFESGLRYLAPTLVIGLALLPAAPTARHLLSAVRSYLFPVSGKNYDRKRARASGGGMRSYLSSHSGKKYDRLGPWALGAGALAAIAIVAVGYPVQRHYLENRYADPSFAAPGLNAAFAWAQGIDDARIATTSTRQYPLYGRDLSNEVDYVGEPQPHGGFTAPQTCPQWRRLLNNGDYDYVVTSKDRIEPDKPAYPTAAAWTAGPWSETVLREPPTVVYRLRGSLPPSSCPS